MSGTNAGTGQPYSFRCAGCKRKDRDGIFDWAWAADVVFTGKIKRVPFGHGGSRVTFNRIQYRCKKCGHVGWSRHSDVARAFVARGGKLLVERR